MIDTCESGIFFFFFFFLKDEMWYFCHNSPTLTLNKWGKNCLHYISLIKMVKSAHWHNCTASVGNH